MGENMFTKILGYDVFNKTKNDFIKYIENFDKINIVSGNPEVLYNGINDPVLFECFTQNNSVIIPDGVGTVLASKVIKKPVAEKIAGIDVMKSIIEKCENENKTVYFLGAKQNVLENCIKNLKSTYKNLKIAGSHNGYFNLDSCEDIINDINKSRPYAIFVAMGSPKQDIFISRNLEKLPCSIFMGVGGSFDVFSGNVKRAPKWMIGFGLEWLYRVIKEPWRIRRLSSIPKFLIKVIEYNRVN